MQRNPFCVAIATVVATLVTPARAAAVPIELGADAGYTAILNGEGMSGFGVDFFGGYAFEFGLVPELQLGFHYNSISRERTQLTRTSIPVMVGARYQFDLDSSLVPYVDGHFGLTVTRDGGSLGNVDSKCDTGADFSFNVGTGLEFRLNGKASLGAGFRYWMVLSGGDRQRYGVTIATEHQKILSTVITFHFRLD